MIRSIKSNSSKECPGCKKQIRGGHKHLLNHMKNFTICRKKIEICLGCGKQFATKIHLQNHQRHQSGCNCYTQCIQNSEKLDHVNSLSLNTGPFITSKNYTNNKRKIFEVSQPIVMSNKQKGAKIQNQFENEIVPYHTHLSTNSNKSTSIPSTNITHFYGKTTLLRSKDIYQNNATKPQFESTKSIKYVHKGINKFTQKQSTESNDHSKCSSKNIHNNICSNDMFDDSTIIIDELNSLAHDLDKDAIEDDDKDVYNVEDDDISITSSYVLNNDDNESCNSSLSNISFNIDDSTSNAISTNISYDLKTITMPNSTFIYERICSNKTFLPGIRNVAVGSTIQ